MVRKPPGNRPGAAIRLASRILWAIDEGPRLASEVQKAKEVIRSSAFFDGPASLKAFRTIIQCLEIASLPYYPASLQSAKLYVGLPGRQQRQPPGRGPG